VVKKNKESVRITIDRELFDLILDQAQKMNEVCHGVLDIDISKKSDILRKASKIVAKKYKGEV
jgi:hypothetical protein